LTRSKKEVNPSFTWVLFDVIQRDSFCPEGKKLKNFGLLRGIFQTQTKDG